MGNGGAKEKEDPPLTERRIIQLALINI